MQRIRTALRTLGTIISDDQACVWLFVGMFVFGMASGPVSALSSVYLGKLVDAVGIVGADKGIIESAAMVSALALLSCVIEIIGKSLDARLGIRLDIAVSDELMRFNSDMDYLTCISSRHRDDMESCAYNLSLTLRNGMAFATALVSSVVSFVSYAVVIYSNVGIIALVAAFLSAVVTAVMSRKEYKAWIAGIVNVRGERRKMTYLRSLLSKAEPFIELTLFGFLPRVTALYEETFDSYVKKKLNAEKKAIRYKVASKTLCAAVSVVTTIMVYFIGNIESAGALTVVFLSLNRLIYAATSIPELFIFGVGDMIERLNILDEYRNKYMPSPISGEAPKRVKGAPAIEISSADFSYGETDVLRGVTLTVSPGETVAIVGENGAGKTTLANLILGLFKCARGSVNVFGRDAYEARRHGAVDSVAVMQQFGRYEALTLNENISFGKDMELDDLEQLDAFFAKRQYDTVIGEMFGGANFSGGEWQKIALARCTASKADIMILDEPTAALDPMAEVAVFDSFMRANKGKTCILITHRLGAARKADRIIVLKNNAIFEQGTHDELMRCCGYYAEMFNAQAEWYLTGDAQ